MRAPHQHPVARRSTARRRRRHLRRSRGRRGRPPVRGPGRASPAARPTPTRRRTSRRPATRSRPPRGPGRSSCPTAPTCTPAPRRPTATTTTTRATKNSVSRAAPVTDARDRRTRPPPRRPASPWTPRRSSGPADRPDALARARQRRRTPPSPTNRYNMFNACYGLQSATHRSLADRHRRAHVRRRLGERRPRRSTSSPRALGPLPALQPSGTVTSTARRHGGVRRRPRARPPTGSCRCRATGSSPSRSSGKGLPDRRALVQRHRHRHPVPAACTARGCAAFPEITTNVSGDPFSGVSSIQEVRGFIDAHTHGMAFEFLGGDVHCGRPWSPYGVTVALQATAPTTTLTNGYGAVMEDFLVRHRPPTTRSAGRPSRTGRRRTR